MTATQAATATLVDALRTVIDRVRAVQAALDSERAALTGREPGALGDAVQQKIAALTALDRALQERDRVQQGMGLPAGNEGTQRFVAQSGDQQAAEVWDELRRDSLALEAANSVNGQLAAAGERHVRQALAILTGRQASADGYGRRGTTQSSVDSQLLGRA